MHGNLYEWCNDWYATYSGNETNPTGPATGTYRVIRGGYWDGGAQLCRSASRRFSYPAYSDYGLGFRPVRSAD
jgi:formylglycine-generating enzyme required for sulfatase activity